MKGTVWKFGDDIDTDIILPGRYLIYTDEEKLSQHCMEGLDDKFNEKCKKGDFIVAGKNFGCGSSREHAPIALKGVGVAAVIAESFARIFYRNATNVGVPLLEAPGITKFVENEEEIEAEKDSNSRQNIGELGVRVQTGGMTSDPTAKHAIRNVMTRDALINCDFSGDVLDGVDHPEAYMKDSSVDEDDNEPV